MKLVQRCKKRIMAKYVGKVKSNKNKQRGVVTDLQMTTTLVFGINNQPGFFSSKHEGGSIPGAFSN